MKRSCLVSFIVLLFACCNKLHTGPDGLIPVKVGDFYGYIDRTGNSKVPFRYARAACFQGGVALVALPGPDTRWGYIDGTGNFALKPNYVYATSFSEGLAFVVEEGGTPQAIDKNGIVKFVLPGAQGAESFNEGFAAFSSLGPQGETWGFVNKDGRTAIEPKFNAVSYFSEGLCGVMNDAGRWGYINKNADVVIDFNYDNAFPFNGNKAKVVVRGKSGIIDSRGHYVLQPAFTDIDIDNEEFLVKRNDRWGWINDIGVERIPVQLSDAYPFRRHKYAAVKAGDKWGYINKEGKFMIAPQYEFAFGFRNNMALVQSQGKYGFIDENGDYLVKPVYDHVPVDYFIHYFAGTSAHYSVKTDVNHPGSVAYKWLTGFYHMDFDEARKYGTEDTRMMMDKFEDISDMISDSTRQLMGGLMVGIKDCKESGNRAIVTYTLSDNRRKEQMLFLVREGRKWRVQFSKNDIPEDVMEEG